MFTRSLILLTIALLATLVAAKNPLTYKTILQQGAPPERELKYLGHFGIPDGQCSGVLRLTDACTRVGKPLGVAGFRTLRATIEDGTPAKIVFESVDSFLPGRLNNIVVNRDGDCKGKVHLRVYYECDDLGPRQHIEEKHNVDAE